MERLAWWMRVTGVFYLLQFVMTAAVHAPIRAFGPAGALDRASAGDPLAVFLVDTWVTFGLEVGAIGVALLVASRVAARAKALVWTVLGIEMARGILNDVVMVARGKEVAGYLVWIVIHSAVIATGLLCLERARSRTELVPALHHEGELSPAGR